MRRKITLTESQFNNLVRKCVNEAIDEAWYNDWNDFKHGAKKTALGMAAAGSLSAVSPLSADNTKDNDYVYAQQMSQDELFNDVIKKAIKQSRLNGKIVTYDEMVQNFGEPNNIKMWRGKSTDNYDKSFVRTVINGNGDNIKMCEIDGDFYIASYR